MERVVKLLGGMTFFAHEVFVNEGERPYLLLGILGLLGITEMVRLDRRSQQGPPTPEAPT